MRIKQNRIAICIFIIAVVLAGIVYAQDRLTRTDRDEFALSQASDEDEGKRYFIGPHQTIQDAVDNAQTGDTIVLRPRVYKENVIIDSDLDAKKLTIEGWKSEECKCSEGTIVDGGGSGGSVFTIGANEEVTISGLTITNGQAVKGGGIANYGTLTLKDVAVTGNTATGVEVAGGGIYNSNSGILTLKDAFITSNVANTGSTTDANGGGIYNDGILNIDGGSISRNSAAYGGGIYNFGGMNAATVTLNDGSISRNTATKNGGGIYGYGILNLEGGSISRNTARLGGGIYSFSPYTIFDGTEITVKYNKAYQPDYPYSWWRGWGVWASLGEPIMKGGFDPAKQVTDNIHIS